MSNSGRPMNQDWVAHIEILAVKATSFQTSKFLCAEAITKIYFHL